MTRWTVVAGVLALAVTVVARSPATMPASAPGLRQWDAKLYLEDDAVDPAASTSIIVSITSHSMQLATLSTLVQLQRQSPAEEGPTAPVANEDESLRKLLGDALRVVVTVRGDFPAAMSTVLPVRSQRIQGLKIERGQSHLLVEPIPAETFRQGDYQLQASLFDGENIIAQSKLRTIHVNRTR